MRRTDRAVNDKSTLMGILTQADTCHLAMVDDVVPYLVTMNFGFDWEGDLPVLFFHSAPEGRKIRILKTQPRVCFSLDTGHELVRGPRACDFGMRYQSLVGYGTIDFLTQEGDRRRGLDAMMAKFAGPGPFDYDARILTATTVFRLTVTEMEGKVKS